MRLLYITNGITGSGGLERVLSIKTSYLSDTLNYEVHIVSLNENTNSTFYQFSSKVNFHSLSVSSNKFHFFFQYRKGIQSAIESINPDIISVCDDGLKGVLFPIIFRCKVPIIYERHASINLNFIKNKNGFGLRRVKEYLERLLMSWGAKKFNAFVVLTNGNKNDWVRVECTVIPNPLPFNLSNDFKENLLKNKTVLAVGSQNYNKGYDRLIKIWEIVVEKHPDWVLKIFGKQNKELGLQQCINKLGLNKSILLYDPIREIENQYKESSIYVMPSRSEGFGMVLIEAMSFGVPCISFDCPFGPADVVSHNRDGFLIENGNIKLFANYLSMLMSDEDLRVTMGKRAVEKVKRYELKRIMERWDGLFVKLVEL